MKCAWLGLGLAAGMTLQACGNTGTSGTTASSSSSSGGAMAPAAPTGLGAVVAGTTVTLSWVNNAMDATSILVERQIGDDGAYEQIQELAGTAVEATDPDRTPGVMHMYKVRARNAAGDSAPTSEIHVVIPDAAPITPTAPTNASVLPMHGGLHLVWRDASDNETGFEVERMPAGGQFSRIRQVAQGVTEWMDLAGLSAGTVYTYRVRAVNAGGPGPYSNETSGTAP